MIAMLPLLTKLKSLKLAVHEFPNTILASLIPRETEEPPSSAPLPMLTSLSIDTSKLKSHYLDSLGKFLGSRSTQTDKSAKLESFHLYAKLKTSWVPKAKHLRKLKKFKEDGMEVSIRVVDSTPSYKNSMWARDSSDWDSEEDSDDEM
jgi:hypothetical protein